MSFLWGLALGLVVGGCLGVVIMALMVSASQSDDMLLGDDQYDSTRR